NVPLGAIPEAEYSRPSSPAEASFPTDCSNTQPSEDDSGDGAAPTISADCTSQAAARRMQAEAKAFSVAAKNPAAISGPRSSEYARVLDRYISRLASMKKYPEALALYRREIDHNPNDAGLYERLAGFLEQNRLDADTEHTYRLAMERFPDRSWYHKLARWYLRRDRQSDYQQLTRQVIQIFSGSELERYFADTCCATSQIYLALNLYAHQRFPHNLEFVRNLLNAYHSLPTYNDAAWLALIRQNWFHAPDLRAQFFATLSRTGALDSELAALRSSNPAV